MSKLRIFYDEAGRVAEVEHRPEEDYSDENIAASTRNAGLTSFIVVDSDELADAPHESLRVENGELRRSRARRGQAAETTRRIEELREINKTELSDEEW